MFFDFPMTLGVESYPKSDILHSAARDGLVVDRSKFPIPIKMQGAFVKSKIFSL